MLSFRDTVKQISPPWLRKGTGEKLLYALALPLDVLTAALAAGVKLRFPNVYSPESLPIIGRERRIRRGRNESNAVYSARLTRWLDDHRGRGGPYALLAQIHAHFAEEPFQVELVYFSGRRFAKSVNGDVTITDITWLPDADAAKWARFWLFYHLTDPVDPDGVWGDGQIYGDGGAWGSDLTVAEADDYRAVPREWNAAHSTGRVVLLSGGAELWGFPTGTWGDPGGVWGTPVQLDVGTV